MLLSNKVALVTGGGRGIGAAISRVLAQHGASVAINYSQSREKADALAEEITAAGGQAQAFAADVRDADSVRAMFEQVTERFGRIDGLINNALAGKQDGSLEDATYDDYQSAFNYGCHATINTVRAARPIMKAQGGGRIVNIVTELWNVETPNWSVYMAGKGAMVGISRSLAVELAPENITLNMVAPGWMADEKVDPESEVSINFGKGIPLRRHGSADEIGKACVFYLSDLSSYVTGSYLPVTGGRVTQMGA